MMKPLGFFPLAAKRLASRLLLSLLLVSDLALSVGITLGIPVFAGGVSRRILQQEMSVRSQIRGWPLFSVRISAEPTERQPIGIGDVAATREWLQDALVSSLRLPVTSVNVEVQSPMYRLAPRAGDERYTTEYLAGVQVVYVQDVEGHVDVYEGSPLGQINDPAQLNVWVDRESAQELAFQVGEEYDLGDLFSSSGELIPIRIAGFWEASEPDDRFWPERPQSHFDGRFLVTAEQFDSFILQGGAEQAGSVAWYYVFDDDRVRLDRAEQYTGALKGVTREVQRRLPAGRMDLDPGEDLLRGQRRKESLSVVLYGFSIPLLVILAHAVSSLSETQSRLQEQEVSMLVSRGSTAWQLLLVSMIESLLIIGAAIPIGAILALMLAHLLGYSTGFLSFSLREPLPVSLLSAEWAPTLVILALGLLVRLRATSRASRRTLVAYEQVYTRQTRLGSLARTIFIAFLFLATAYAYRLLTSRGVILSSLDALDPRNDPLVLLAPTLFIFAAPLLAAEVYMALVHPVGLIGRFLPGVALYLASMNLVRAGVKYRASIYRLTLSLTLGVFYASVAKSADIWLVDSLRYRYGADLVLKLTADQGADRFGTFGSSDEEMLEIAMVPSEVYQSVPGVRAASRVAEFEATLQPSTGIPYYRLLAVERFSLPRVLYTRSDYASESFGGLMNRLAQEPKGILVPSSIAGKLATGVGDVVNVRVNIYGDVWVRFDGRVVGFFDYFPTMYPDGKPVIIANLDYLEMNAGVLPHDVWLSLEEGAETEAVLKGINKLGVPIRQAKDLNLVLATESQRLERTGVFGLLSFCFVAGAALSVADVLVYTTAMLRERALHHAVLRALGLGRRSVMASVVLEQAASLSYGLLVGIACGVVCALLYGPYFPIGSTTNPPVPPFVSYVDWPRAWWIAVLTGVALALAQVIVLVNMMRTHLFEVLRMGVRP